MKARINIWRKWIPILLLVLIPCTIIYRSFSKVLACPECYLFNDAGDGLKNYFTLTWYVLHDDGVHFTGMNAPYGEHVLFTDNQPILAFFLRFIHKNIVDLEGHTVGILNIFLILSLLICCWVLYLIFRQLAMKRFASVAFAIVITFLSPQIDRFLGHYGLAYPFIVPLYLLFIIKLEKAKQKWKWGVAIILWTLIAGLLHLYHFLMLASFTFFYLLVTLIKIWFVEKRQGFIKYQKKILWLIGGSILPAIILLGGMSLTDHIEDRPINPWHGMALNAKFNSTFVPNYGPFQDYWKKNFGTLQPTQENVSYVSLIGLFLIPIALVFIFRRRKKRYASITSNDQWMHTALLTSICVWALAAGIIYSPMFVWVTDLIPKLKQFRGLARLSWVFYYVYTIFIAFYLTRLARYLSFKRIKNIGGYLIVLAVAVMGFEGYLINQPIFSKVNHDNNFLSKKKDNFSQELYKKGYKADDFQAVLSVPLISAGGENAGIARGNWTMRRGIQASFELGIPLVDYSLSRTSVSQTLDFIQLLSSDAVEKVRLKSMNDKPILMIAEENLASPAEKKLIQKGKLIGETEQVKLYVLRPLDINGSPENRMSTSVMFQNATNVIYEMDFENDAFYDPFIGNGVMKIFEKPEKIDTYFSEVDSAVNAKIHLWFYIDNKDASMSVLRVREIDEKGKIISDRGYHREDVDWAEVAGQWVRLDRDITIQPNYSYEFFIDVNNTIVDGLQILMR